MVKYPQNTKAEPHMLKRSTALPTSASSLLCAELRIMLSLCLSTSVIRNGCFLLEGFCNAAHSSSHKAVLLIAKPIFMVCLQNKCKIVLASDELSFSLATRTPSASWVGTVNTVG